MSESPPGSTRPAGTDGSRASSFCSASHLVLAGDDPEEAANPVKLWVSQGHPADALVLAGRHRDALVGDIEDGVAGDQRGGMAVRAEAEMGEIEGLRQRRRIAVGRSLQVVVGHRHRADAALGADREALDQVCEVALVVSGRRHALVHLEDLGLRPVHLEVLELGEHRPRVAAAANRQGEVVPLGDGGPRGLGDQLRAPLVDGVRRRRRPRCGAPPSTSASPCARRTGTASPTGPGRRSRRGRVRRSARTARW